MRYVVFLGEGADGTDNYVTRVAYVMYVVYVTYTSYATYTGRASGDRGGPGLRMYGGRRAGPLWPGRGGPRPYLPLISARLAAISASVTS